MGARGRGRWFGFWPGLVGDGEEGMVGGKVGGLEIRRSSRRAISILLHMKVDGMDGLRNFMTSLCCGNVCTTVMRRRDECRSAFHTTF